MPNQPRPLGRSQLVTVCSRLALAGIVLTGCALSAMAQSAPAAPKRPTEVYVPTSDLDAIVGPQKRGVLLPRSQFEELLRKAEQNALETPDIPDGIAVVSADYQGRIVGSQVLLAATIKLNQVVAGWRFLRLPLTGIGLESATLDGHPALLGSGGSPRELRLFSNQRSTHTFVFAASVPLVASGGDREAVFRLGDLPVGTVSLEVAANQRLFVGGKALERPSPLDKPATYSFPVGSPTEIRLRLTDRSLEQASDRLLFGETTYRLNVSFGDAAWHATTLLDARGTAVEHLAVVVPEGLQITAIESTGLDSWKPSAATPQKPATIELSYRQAFTGQRTIQFHGVLRPGTDRRWRAEALKIQGVTAHIGRIEIVHPSDLRLWIESATNLRTGETAAPSDSDPFGSATNSTVPNPPNSPTPDKPTRYDAWNEQFSLVFSVTAKPREVQADLLTALEVSSSGLELQLAASLESLYSPVFEVEVTLPAEWTPTALLVSVQPVEWRELSAEAGTRHLLVTLPKPVPPGVRVPLTFAAQKSAASGPIDETGIELALPEVRLLNAAAISGSYVIRAGDDFELTPSDVKGLDPAHLNLERERIGYRYQDTRFSGKVKVARRPARLSAETLLVARLDRTALRTHVRTTIEARGGGFRRLDVFLPESVSKEVRFQTDDGEVAIADQSVSVPARGERHWTLTFTQYVHGSEHIQTLIDTPRGDAKEFRIPEPRLEGVARHSGTVVVQAAPDQQLRVTATGADNQPLREIDQADLPAIPDKTDDRTVGAYRFVQPGNQLTLAETRYAPVGVARAVCTKCEIQSVVPLTGECQHTATFQFLATGVQSLHLVLPEGSDLWAALIDNQPVEVRRGQSGYELPLKPGPNPDVARVLALFYATPELRHHDQTGDRTEDEEGAEQPAASSGILSAGDVGAGFNPRFQQAPPEVSVVGSGGTPERMEMLGRSWNVYFPHDLTVRESSGAFRPNAASGDQSFLTQLLQNAATVTAEDIGWKLLEFLGVIVVAALCVRGYLRWGASGIVGAMAVVAVIAVLWLTTLFTSGANQSATLFESKSTVKSDMPSAYIAQSRSASDAMVESRSEASRTDNLRMRPPAKTRPPMAIAKGGMGGEGGKKEKDDVEFDAAPRTDGKPASLRSHTIRNLPGRQVDTAPGDQKKGEEGARLSVAIGFEPQLDSSHRTFEYIGRESSGSSQPMLDLEFESLTGRRAFCGAVVAMVTVLFWSLRRRSWRVKGTFGALGLLLPVALAGVTPIRLEVWLDGIFLGTLCGMATWLIYGFSHRVGSVRRPTSTRPSSGPARPLGAAGTVLLIAALMLSAPSTRAAEERTAKSQTARPIVVPRPRPGNPVVIPYDPDHNALAADRVLLEQRTLLELWNRAHPDRPLGTHPTQEACVTEALYTARPVSAAGDPKSAGQSDRGHLAVAGHLALYSLVDRPVNVPLPFHEGALKSAKLDGKPALLVPHATGPVPGPADGEMNATKLRRFDVILPTPGAHVLEIELELPARLAGPSGEFTFCLLPVASGRLSLELPVSASTVHVSGSDAAFRRRPDGSKEWIDVPIASAGDLTVSWQPAQEVGSSARSIESIAKTLVALDDAGLRIVSRFSLQIRQAGVSELSFALPPNSKLRDIRGGDVAGWKIEGNEPARKLIVGLRKSVTVETRVELDLFQPLTVGESPLAVSAALPAPLDVVRQTGMVAVTAGPQFDLRAPNLPGATRIDAREFDLPELAQNSELNLPHGLVIEAAFRYVGRPASVESMVARRSSQTDVTALDAVLVGRRKLTLSSQFHIQPAGIALTQAQFRLPAGFLALSIEGLPLTDWYVSGVAGAKNLVVEFASPQSAPFDLILNGTVPKNPDDAKTALDVPTLSGTRRAETHLAVWLDGSYQATIAEAADWKSISPDQAPPAMKALVAAPPRLAFETRRPEPAAISLNLAHAVARLTGDSATIVTVTDAAVFYTLAMHWTISQATADTFALTMPDWLAARLDLTDPQAVNASNPRRRQTVSTTLGTGRVRWTIELQDPVADQLFLTATAVLPLPKDGKIVAPTLGFESEEPSANERRLEPLATQRHFLVVVNQSAGQLTETAGNPIEVVDRGGLPMQVDAQLLRQAMLVGRLTRTDASASWRLDRPAIRRGAAAFVNLADLVTVIEPGGTWRTQATYRVKNLSRQFLAVEIPEQSEILSVVVQHKPVRAVRAVVGGKTFNLIPLPEVSEGDLSFDAQLVIAGRLGGSLPEGVRLLGTKVSLVAPQVVTWETDADYGIPVARTRWTLWFPKDQQVRVLTSAQETNLDQADEFTATVFERSALVDEAKQLLSVIDSGASTNSMNLAYGNLSRINGELDQRNLPSARGANAPLEAQLQGEQSVLQRMKDIRKRALPGEQDRTEAQPAKEEKVAQQQAKPLTPETQAAQAKDLIEWNSQPQGKSKAPSSNEFGFRDQNSPPSETGVIFRNLPQRPAQKSGERNQKTEELKGAADLEKQLGELAPGSRPQPADGKQGQDLLNPLDQGAPTVGQGVPTSPLGQFGAPVFSSGNGITKNGGDGIRIQGAPPAAPAVGPSNAEPRKKEPSRSHSPGTLSLAFDIPKEGQMLVFTKAGGDPKLTVELRPRKSFEVLLGALWMLPWIFLLWVAILLFGQNRYAATAWRRLPFGLMAIGLLLFVVLPPPVSFVGLALVAAGTIQASVSRHRQAAGR
jgi:hypothetical protein